MLPGVHLSNNGAFVSFRISLHRDRSSVRAWLVLVCLSILQFFIAVDVTVVNVALPSIGAEFGASESQLTWVVVAYTITGGGLLMLGGRLGDVFGRRRVLLTGTAIFGAASYWLGSHGHSRSSSPPDCCRESVKRLHSPQRWRPSSCSSPKGADGHGH